MNTASEKEFFEQSSELMRNIAASIEHSHFNKLNNKNSIPYGKQSIEMAIENLQDCLAKSKVIQYDN